MRKPHGVTTKRWLIDNVAQHWQAQYLDGWTWRIIGHPSAPRRTQDTYNRLVTLPAGATEEDVTAIIGNNSWTRNTCDQCEQDVAATVLVGAAPTIESRTASLCRDCVLAALTALDENQL